MAIKLFHYWLMYLFWNYPLCFAESTTTPKVLQEDGTVALMTGSLLVIYTNSQADVENDRKVIELTKDDELSQVPGDLKVGDEVTFWYVIHAKRVMIKKSFSIPIDIKSKSNRTNRDKNPLQPWIVEDDRVFYGA